MCANPGYADAPYIVTFAELLRERENQCLVDLAIGPVRSSWPTNHTMY